MMTDDPNPERDKPTPGGGAKAISKAEREEALYALHSTPRMVEVVARDETKPTKTEPRTPFDTPKPIKVKEVQHYVIGPLTAEGFDKLLKGEFQDGAKGNFRGALNIALSQADIEHIKEHIAKHENTGRAVAVFNESKLTHIYTGRIIADAKSDTGKMEISGYMDYNNPQKLELDGLYTMGAYAKRDAKGNSVPFFSTALDKDGQFSSAGDIVTKLPSKQDKNNADGPCWTSARANNKQGHWIRYMVSDAMDVQRYRHIVHPKLDKTMQQKMDAYLDTLDDEKRKNLRIVATVGRDARDPQHKSMSVRQLFVGAKQGKNIIVDQTIDCLDSANAEFKRINATDVPKRFTESETEKSGAGRFLQGFDSKKLSLLPMQLQDGMKKALAEARDALADMDNIVSMRITLTDGQSTSYAGAPKPRDKSGNEPNLV